MTSVLFTACNNSNSSKNQSKANEQISLSGKALGTFYNIKYYDKKNRNLQKEIDELLAGFNKSLSTYDPESVISKINKNIDVEPDDYFIKCFLRAEEISKITNGAFDMTVAPLVNVWNFGFSERKHPDSIVVENINIDSILLFTGYEKISYGNGKIIKTDPRIMLDASAIAKGYAVDVVGEFLENKGINSYLVEIGGEIRVKGEKPNGTKWSVAIDKPIDQNNTIIHEQQDVVILKDKSLATSGNYRQFYEKDGVKYSHTINPKTGYPVQHNLLSATVMTNDCMSADAFATAFMVLGLEKSVELLKSLPDVQAYLIYFEDGQNKVYKTDGMKLRE